VLSSNSELQALTPSGVGSRTVLDHIQSHNSSDDGVEFFGGNVGMKYYVATGADDDSLDVDTGARLDLQHALLIQRPGMGDALMEIDSNGNEGDTPRTRLRVANFVGLQPQVSANNESNDQAAMLFRANSDITLVNRVIATPNNECIRLHGTSSTPVTFTAHSAVMQCNAAKFTGSVSFDAAALAPEFNAETTKDDVFTATLSSLVVTGSSEDVVVAFGASRLSSLFEVPRPNRIGGAWSGNHACYPGWT